MIVLKSAHPYLLFLALSVSACGSAVKNSAQDHASDIKERALNSVPNPDETGVTSTYPTNTGGDSISKRPIPVISLHEKNYVENPSDLLEDGVFIPLSSSAEEGYFSSIYQLLIANDTLIVYDNQNKKILLYDRQGNFLHAINRLGKGPGEYAGINNIDYQDHLYILDPASQQIHRYDLSGNWLKSLKYDPSATGTNFAKSRHAYLFYRNSIEWATQGKGHNFASFSTTNFAFIDSASYIVKELARRGLYTTNPFAKHKNNVYALPPFEDFIYQMGENGQIDTAFAIDVPEGSRLTDEPDWYNTSIKNLEFMTASNKFQCIYFYGSLSVTDQHLFFGFRKNQNHHYCLYNKKTGKTIYFESKGLLMEKDVSLFLLAAQGDEFYFQMHAKERATLSAFVGEELGEDVNAVLYKVQFKK